MKFLRSVTERTRREGTRADDVYSGRFIEPDPLEKCVSVFKGYWLESLLSYPTVYLCFHGPNGATY